MREDAVAEERDATRSVVYPHLVRMRDKRKARGKKSRYLIFHRPQVFLVVVQESEIIHVAHVPADVKMVLHILVKLIEVDI